MPPDRLDAPSPGARASSTTTDRPARASVSADANPAYPAPMIATSQLFGSAASVGDSGGAASHQYGSWESDPDSVCMFSPFLSWSGNCMITGRESLHLDSRQQRATTRWQKRSTAHSTHASHRHHLRRNYRLGRSHLTAAYMPAAHLNLET